MKHHRESAGIAAILIASLFNVVMGAGFFYARKMDPSYSPMAGVFIRVICNFLFVLVPFAWSKEWPALLSMRSHRSIWIWGLCGFFTTMAFFQSITILGAGLSSFLNAGSGIFIASLAPFFAHQKTPLRDWLGVVCSLFGLFLISKVDFEGQTIGFILGISSGLFAGFAYLMVARTRGRYSPESIMLHWSVVSLAGFSLLFLFHPFSWPSVNIAWVLLIVTGFAAAFGQYFTAKAYQNAPASLVACLSYVSPVMSVFIDFLYFKIPVHSRVVWGILIVLFFGTSLPFFRHKRSKSRNAAIGIPVLE